MKKVLITGGAGFIGYHIATRLSKRGDKVVLLDNFSRGVSDPFLKELEHQGADLRTIDLLDADAVAQLEDDFDQIYHLAAIIGVANVLKQPYSVLRDNILMLINMFELSHKQKHLQRFLFPSTSEVYAGVLLHYDLPIPTPEETPLTVTPLEHPRTSYMLSKIYGEALTHQSEVPFTIIRPHNVYGPRMGLAHVVPELFKKAAAAADDGELEVFSPSHKRTFCYVDDAVDQITGLVDSSEANGGTYNIGSTAEEISIYGLAEQIVRILGKDLTIKSLDETPGSPSRRRPLVDRTNKIAGKEDFVSLEEGLRRCYDWYSSHVFDGSTRSAQ